MEHDIQDLIERQRRRVQSFVAAKHMSKNRLAALAGLPQTTLTGIESEKWQPMPKTLAALIRAIDEFGKVKKKPTAKEAHRVAVA